jgi:hypothetical protein
MPPCIRPICPLHKDPQESRVTHRLHVDATQISQDEVKRVRCASPPKLNRWQCIAKDPNQPPILLRPSILLLVGNNESA